MCDCGKWHAKGEVCQIYTLCVLVDATSQQPVRFIPPEVGDNYENYNYIDLTSFGIQSYLCACGEKHFVTEECPQKLPVYIAKLAEVNAATQPLDISALSSKLPGEFVKNENDASYRWVAYNVFRVKTNAKATAPVYLNYECLCGDLHSELGHCSGNNGNPFPVFNSFAYDEPGYIIPSGFPQRWVPLNTAVGSGRYLCKCGDVHQDASECSQHHEVRHVYECPSCHSFVERNHLCCNAYYFCQCGQNHSKTLDCTGNNGQPYPVYKDDVAGYVCECGKWHDLNTCCNTVARKGGRYLCLCGETKQLMGGECLTCPAPSLYR